MTQTSPTNNAAQTVPRSEVILEFDFKIATRDGVMLSCNLARPAGDGRWPVIVIRTPYSKDGGGSANPLLDLSALAREGFVGVVQDVRQRSKSDGEGDYVPFVKDAEDGADLIAWAAALPYGTGDVFAVGPSYCGFVQWAAATQQPPGLRAIAPAQSISSPWRTLLYRGGAVELSGCVAWFMFIGVDTLMRRHARDPATMGAALGKLMADLDSLHPGGFKSLPLDSFAPLASNRIGDCFFEMLAAGDDAGSPMLKALIDAQNYERITIPAHISGGWFDYFIQGSIDQFVGMRARGGSTKAREQTRLVIGPWTHGSQSHINGDRNFGMSASPMAAPRGGLKSDTLKFFREQITGAPTNCAPIKIFVMGTNIWRDEWEWPLARTRITPWYLASDGNANSVTGGGMIAPQARPSPPDTFLYDPADPVPTCGGNNLPGLVELGGPRDQRLVEARRDVLVYSSAVLAEDLEITGTVVVELWATTSAVDTDFVARLVDVQSDGTAWNVTDGILRGRYRDSPESVGAGSALRPGQPYCFRIELHPTSNVFKAGNRLRVDITSSSFPRWARNLNIWNQHGGTLADAQSARQQILHDDIHSSRVLLPVIPARDKQ